MKLQELLAILETAQGAVARAQREALTRRDEKPWAILAFDLETTGPDPHADSICQIAMKWLPAGRPAGAEDSLGFVVNPGRHIPREASEVHGIWNDEAQKHPLFLELAPQIQRMFSCADATLAYNGLRFDNIILAREFNEAGAPLELPPMLDPFVWASWHDRGRSLKLGDVCSDLGVSLTHAHDARGDVLGLIQLAGAMVQRGQMPGCIGLLLEIQPVLAGYIQAERAALGNLLFLDRQTAAVRCGGKNRGALLRDVETSWIDWALKNVKDMPPLAREMLTRTQQERRTR